jgi:hypothetical protein
MHKIDGQSLTSRIVNFAKQRHPKTFRSADVSRYFGIPLQTASNLLAGLRAKGRLVIDRTEKSGRATINLYIWAGNVPETSTPANGVHNIFNYLAARGYDDDFEPDRLPAMPTAEKPGSLEKINVLRRRLEAGEDLKHPFDRTDFSLLVKGKRGLSW